MSADPLDGRAAGPAAPSVRRAALLLLARRPRTVKEMRTILLRRHEGEQVEAVLADLVSSGGLDDRRTGGEWLRFCREARPMGRVRLEMELRRRGIDHETVSELLTEYYRGGSEAEDLERALGAFLRGKEPAPGSTGLRRLAARLQRRGFETGEVREALERLRRGDGAGE